MQIQLIYDVGACLIKISFGITLLRFLQERRHIYFLYFNLFVVVFGSVFIFFWILFFCTPIDYQWKQVLDPYTLLLHDGINPSLRGIKPHGTCKNINVMINAGYGQIAMLMFTDLSLGLVLPILLLKNLNMRRSLKIGTGFILGIGAIPGIASAVRIKYAPALAQPEIFMAALPLFLWGTIEQSGCIIATSCATFKPLFVRLFGEKKRRGPSDSEMKTSYERRQRRNMNPLSWTNASDTDTTRSRALSGDESAETEETCRDYRKGEQYSCG